MRDEAIEIIAPEVLEKYRRWRPRFTALQVIATVAALISQGVTIWDVKHGMYYYWLAYGLIMGASILWFLSLFFEKRMTKGASALGALFGSKTRIVLSALWFAATVTGYSTMQVLYDPPLSKRKNTPPSISAELSVMPRMPDELFHYRGTRYWNYMHIISMVKQLEAMSPEANR